MKERKRKRENVFYSFNKLPVLLYTGWNLTILILIEMAGNFSGFNLFL